MFPSPDGLPRTGDANPRPVFRCHAGTYQHARSFEARSRMSYIISFISYHRERRGMESVLDGNGKDRIRRIVDRKLSRPYSPLLPLAS